MTTATGRTAKSLSTSTEITLRVKPEHADPEANVNAVEIGGYEVFVPIKISKSRVFVEVYVTDLFRYLIVNHDLDMLVGEEHPLFERTARLRFVASKDDKPAVLAAHRSKANDSCPIYFTLAEGDRCECEFAACEHKHQRIVLVLLKIRKGRATFDVTRKRGRIQTRPIASLLNNPK